MRLVALMLVVFLTTSPLAEAWSIRESVSEPCPMAATMHDGGPCVTAPCGCDHSSQAASLSSPGPTALPRTSTGATPLDGLRSCVERTAASPARGFPLAVDRPPTTRA